MAGPTHDCVTQWKRVFLPDWPLVALVSRNAVEVLAVSSSADSVILWKKAWVPVLRAAGHEFCKNLELFWKKNIFASQACQWEQLERRMASNFCLKQKSCLGHTLTLWRLWGNNGCFKLLGRDHLFFRTGKQTLSSISMLYAIYAPVEGLKYPRNLAKSSLRFTDEEIKT